MPTTHHTKKAQSSYLCAFFTAVRFLTVIPFNWNIELDEYNFKKSLVFFPLVGLIIGGLGYLLVSFCTLLFPSAIIALILVIFLSGISGFLHLDGLADSGDGLLCSLPAERSLEIMKDSRVGAMGVIVLIFLLLGKFVALGEIPISLLPVAAILIPVGGRTAILFSMALFPYARKEGGLGNLFDSSRTSFMVVAGMFFFILLTVLFTDLKTAFLGSIVVVATAIFFGLYCKSRIGGITGDTLGAVCELSEFALALLFAALFINQ